MRRGRLLSVLGAFVAAALLFAGAHAVLRAPAPLTVAVAGRVVELADPRWLYGVVALPYLWLAGVGGGSLADLSVAQQALSLLARGLLLLALLGALARPALVAERRAVAVVAVVDVSDSVSERQLDEARAAVAELRAARRPDDSVAVVTFGARPRAVPLDAGASGAPPLARHDGGATDIAAALRLAEALLPADALRRVLLVSDGNQTGGDLDAEVHRARAASIRVDARAYSARRDDDLAVVDLRLPEPRDVVVGAPFPVEADVYASRPVRATLALSRDGEPLPGAARRTLSLDAGPSRVTFRGEVRSPGVTTFRLAVAPARDEARDFRDRFPQNDAAVASLAVAGRARVLYVEGEPASAVYLERALAAEHVDVETRRAHALPRTPAELGRYDLVVLSNLGAADLGPDATAAIEAYVRDAGGGLLFAGGAAWSGPGDGLAGSRLERLLPVRFDGERRRDEPSLALMLAIDRSGSMQGQKLELAKEAAKASAGLLAPDDLVGVVAFDAQAVPVVRLTRAANRLRIASDISRIASAGGTSILAPLDACYRELASARARVKHVILLTDGEASYDGVAELVGRMSAANITVSAVGVGQGADRTLLGMIAERGGGRFYYTADAESVPRIFTRETTEVARSALVEEPVHARAVGRAALLDGVPIASAPALRGYVTTRARPTAEVLLATDGGAPLLARWRVGLGQAAVWTSDLVNRWASEWVAWPGYQKLFAQLARATMRHRALAGSTTGFTLSTEVEAPTVRARVDAVSPDDRYVTGLDVTLELADALAAPGAPPRTIALPETAPGRYEGELAIARYGSFVLRAVYRRDGRVVGETAGTLSVPYAPEYLPLAPDTALLERAARATGGRLGASAREVLDPGAGAVPWRRPLWPLGVLSAMGLLVVDVLLRRVRLFGYRR